MVGRCTQYSRKERVFVSDIKKLNKEVNRRKFLKGSAATGGLLLGHQLGIGPIAHLARAEEAYPPLGNYPVEGPEVVFGFNVPQTGPYSDEGADELRAYELAVEHLNNGGGMLETMNPSSLTGEGVLGKKVTYVTGDTETKAPAARESARRMIERDKVIMVSGGSSSGVAIAVQGLCQEARVIFMSCLTHSNDTTGSDKRRYGFRHFFNTDMSGRALGGLLAQEYGADRRAFHLTADYTWGHSQLRSMKDFTEAQGWTTVDNNMAPTSTTDFSPYLANVLNSDADVLVLNFYGKNMVDSLSQAVRFGMRELEVNGKTMEVVVPLYSRLMAQGAGDNIEGILGTMNWSYKLEDPGSVAFVNTFVEKYGFPPSQAAHTAYVQTLLYADAVERAGTFYPPEVIRAFENGGEGHSVEGIGPGVCDYRACDHQAFHDILVVKGKAAADRENEYDRLEIVNQVDKSEITYECGAVDRPGEPGELGEYGDEA